MKRTPTGFSLIDIIIGVGLISVGLLSVFSVMRASLILSTNVRAQSMAIEIAHTRMEYLRGLSYDALGTQGGIPAGSLAPIATTTQEGILYTTRTLIEYKDDPADGQGTLDTNHITTDYKVGKVSVSYELSGRTMTVSATTAFPPQGIETPTQGGTLSLRVVDTQGAGLSGARVHVVNSALSPTVDLTTFSNSAGFVTLDGAATSSLYRVTVSRDGYSTADTYPRTLENANPNPGYLTVATNHTTSATFSIDRLAALSLSFIRITEGTTTVPVSGVHYTLTGTKTIGTDIHNAPLYKTVATGISDADGHASLLLEGDAYTLTIGQGTIATTSSPLPLSLSPGEATSTQVTIQL